MSTPEAPSRPQHASRKVPGDVLLVEDNMIIALDAEDMLRELGVEMVRTASNVQRALEQIAEQVPQFALLDVNLGAETSFGIADRLRELGVPLAFATGYSDQHGFPAPFADALMVRKPYSVDTLREALFTAT
jgi:CheY-like chemotaxis protein